MSEKYSDERLDIALGRLLQTGVVLSATLVLGGGIVYLLRHGSAYPEYRKFLGEPKSYRDISMSAKTIPHRRYAAPRTLETNAPGCAAYGLTGRVVAGEVNIE